MSSVPSNPSNPDQVDEQLVAYLDGELEPEAAQRVEHLLAADEQARGRLSQLAASWDLLDQLPRATVDDLFTKTTVEMVAVAAEEELTRADAAAPAKRRRRWLEGVLATAVAAAIGFVLVAVALPNQNDMLLDDLPVIHDLEHYRVVGDIDYLKLYQAEKLFDDYVAGAPPQGPPNQNAAPNGAPRHGAASKAAAPIPASTGERRAWVELLSAPEKIALRDNFEKFAKLSQKEQQALRHLEEQLRDQPELERVMQHYYDWYEVLDIVQRTDIANETTPKDRVAKIKERQQQQDRMTVRGLDRIDPKDSDDAKIVRWMREFAAKHLEELSAAGPGPQRSGRGGRGGRPPNAIALAFDAWWGPNATKLPPLADGDLPDLVAQLSTEKKTEFAAAGDMTAQIALMKKWIRRAVRAARSQVGQQSGFARGGPNPEFLLQQFERELTDDERRELQGLTGTDRTRKQLEFIQKRYPEWRPGGPGLPRSTGGPPPGDGKAPPDRGAPPPTARPNAD